LGASTRLLKLAGASMYPILKMGAD